MESAPAARAGMARRDELLVEPPFGLGDRDGMRFPPGRGRHVPGRAKGAEMPHIVTGRCVDCRYTDCCTVCPVDCFYEIESPAMLVIDPNTCIDCELCVPECPINAIYPESELPEAYVEWKDKNAQLFSTGKSISEKKDPLPTALPLEGIQGKEKKAGWSIDEPSKAG